MKKVMVILGVVFCILVASPVWAADGDNPAAETQLMINIDHAFWEAPVNDNLSFNSYAYAFYFNDLNSDYAQVVAYLGTQMQLYDLTLSILGVVVGDADGLWGGPSLWLELSNEEVYFIAEGDYYTPIASTSHLKEPLVPIEHQYYGYAEYSLFLKDDVSLGLAYETAGLVSEDKAFESAYGPIIGMDRIKLFFFFDQTPIIDKYDLYGARLIINVH